jgi:putative phage-type endonuclease
MDEPFYNGAIDMVEYLDTIQPCPSFRGAFEPWSAALPKIELSDEDTDALEESLYLVGTIFTLFLEVASSAWSAKPLADRIQHVTTLMNRPNVAQRSQEWYDQSRSVLTASEFASILGTPRAVGTLALQKTMPPRTSSSSQACSTSDMGPMDWGVRFEPVVKQILEELWGAEILEIGRLIHPTDPKLAASPDGLLLKADDPARIGRLLEIKCPVRRVINEMIPFEYWCQMQIQMEVADIDECEYVEIKLISPYRGEESYCPPSQPPEFSGHVYILQCPQTYSLVYAYTEDERKTFMEKEFTMVEEIPWHLERMFNKVVVRDRAWFASTAEKRAEFWKCVEETSAGTYVLAPSTRTKVKPVITVCKINDD